MTTTLIVLGAVLAWWILDSLYDPLINCWWCDGSSKRRRKTEKGKRKSFHFCLVCDGSGRRRRFWSAVFGRGLGKL